MPRAASNASSDDSAASGDEIDPKLADSKLKWMKATYDTFRFILAVKGEMLLRTIKRPEDKRQRGRLLWAEMVSLLLYAFGYWENGRNFVENESFLFKFY